MSTCESCHKPVLWAITIPGGRRMPIDPDPVDNGNLVLESGSHSIRVRYVQAGHGTHVSHFATCPQANEWRKR